MTPEQQRIAIAVACGYKDVAIRLTEGTIKVMTGFKNFPFDEEVPDYLNDLNAMHEAEKILNHVKAAEYARMLTSTAWQSEQPVFAPMTATAAQRAEAFLRTLNLWKSE